jgi:hypothetical protein
MRSGTAAAPDRDVPAAAAPPSRLLVWFLRLTVYVLFVIAGTSFLLALLVAAGGLALWFGVALTSGLWLALKLLGLAVAAFLLGLLVHVQAGRRFGRLPASPPQ